MHHQFVPRCGSPLYRDAFAEVLGSGVVGSGYLRMVGLPREGVGAKKFSMSYETQGNLNFWQDILGFSPGYPGAAQKVCENKNVSVQCLSLT